MRRVCQCYYRLKKGPHGRTLIAGAAVCCLAAGMLVASTVYSPFFLLASVFALVSVLAMAVLNAIFLVRLRAAVDDVHAAIATDRTLRRRRYHVGDFFTDGGAANSSLQLFNLKVLSFCRPNKILELGSGQTTKVLSCYARQNSSAYVLTLEQDEKWVTRLRPYVSHDYRHLPLEPTEFSLLGNGLRLNTLWYKDISELRQQRFDYILVDGPDFGTPGNVHNDYSRCGLLRYMPGILAESFVIVFDDAERYGEHMTITALKQILDAHHVRYHAFSTSGTKTQDILCSPDNRYLQSV